MTSQLLGLVLGTSLHSRARLCSRDGGRVVPGLSKVWYKVLLELSERNEHRLLLVMRHADAV